MPNPLNVPITPPRVAFIDPRTGNVSREWYMFFLSLFQLTSGSSLTLDDLQKGPPTLSIDEINRAIDKATESLTPSPGTSELLAQLDAVRQELQTLPQQELGTMASLQQANVPWVTFDTTAENVPPDVGTVAWDGGTTMGIQATTGTVIRVGESEYVYVKASSAITKGQLCYHTGAVGASGVITAAPTPLALIDPNQIVGVASEAIALNDFGLIQISGDLRGFDTTGSSVGETWVDGDPLYYNPAYVGSMTKIKPLAPNQKTYIGEVINAGSGGSGSMHIRIVQGSILGGTDSNVELTSPVNNDVIQYDSALQYWKNVQASTISVGTATNLAGGTQGAVPYQTGPGATTFRSIGTASQVFRVNAGATAPEWVSPAALTKTDDTNVTLTLGGNPTTALLAAASLTLGWTGQLSAQRGGTGFGSYAVGDLLYADTTTTLAKLPDVATGNALISGGVNVAPSWGKIGLTTHVTGTLPIANGGTGLIALGAGVQTWLGTPSSANLAAAITGETGSGALVFATRPSFPNTIGVGGAVASASGAGITFPASLSLSTDPNTLDDYEEGTWTPVITGATVAGTGTYTVQTGGYTKIGDVVNFVIYLAWSTHTGTGSMRVSLPFTAAQINAATVFYPFNIVGGGITAPASTTLAAMGVSTFSFMNIYSVTPGTVVSSATLNMDTAGIFQISGTYKV